MCREGEQKCCEGSLQEARKVAVAVAVVCWGLCVSPRLCVDRSAVVWYTHIFVGGHIYSMCLYIWNELFITILFSSPCHSSQK